MTGIRSLAVPSRPIAPAPRAEWRRASRRELGLLGAYFAGIIVVTDLINVRQGMEMMTVAVVLAALVSGVARHFFRDWWFFLAGLIMWSFSGVVAAHSPFPAHVDIFRQADRLLFFGRDPVVVVQNALAHRGTVGPVDVLAAFIYNMHVPEVYIAGYFLWRLNRAVYLQFSAALLLLFIVSFLTYIFVPSVPPWLAAVWYHQIPTVYNGFGPVLRWHPLPFHGTPTLYLLNLAGDAVAAFPSQHAAIPLLELLAFARCTPRRVWMWLFLWIAAVLFTIVYLGEHWVVDALAGYAYAIAVFAAVLFTSSFGTRASPAARTRPQPGAQPG